MSSPSLQNGTPSPRAAIIAAGKMGYWHGQTARRLGVALVSIIDKDAQRANVLARALRVDVAETHPLTVGAADLKAVGASAAVALIDGDASIMSPLDAAGMAVEQ